MTDNKKSSAGPDLARLGELKTKYEAVRTEIAKVILGQDEVVEQLLISIFASGHCILEGVPGLAKTLLVSTLAKTMSLDFTRIQFTPDLMPSDITGTEVMFEDKVSGSREFKFIKGPIFNNVVLADEINRTPPKTQAALLEGMQERQVSASGQRYELPKPFFVLATQNPIEQEGTYPLPEAQMDRFLFKVVVDYPDRAVEREVYRTTTSQTPEEPEIVVGAEDILEMQELVRRIAINDTVIDYALNLVRGTRPNEPDAPQFVKDWVLIGAGPRGGQALLIGAKTRAALQGRPEATIDDLRALVKPVLRHRIILNYSAEADGQSPDSMIDRLLDSVPVHSSPENMDERVQQVLES
ncbi:MAG: MoxR family ATPase [Planctomycetota bacterium]